MLLCCFILNGTRTGRGTNFQLFGRHTSNSSLSIGTTYIYFREIEVRNTPTDAHAEPAMEMSVVVRGHKKKKIN